MRCISVNKIEITVLSARVLDALSGRGLKAKTVHEFERYGTRRIVKHCLGKGQILYSKETVQNFVWQERAKQESGTLPHYQWGITRRAAVYLDQMAEYGKIQDEPIRPWEAEHNPLFQAISCNPSNSMKVIDIICRTRDAVMQLELSDKTKTNYIYCRPRKRTRKEAMLPRRRWRNRASGRGKHCWRMARPLLWGRPGMLSENLLPVSANRTDARRKTRCMTNLIPSRGCIHQL